MGVIRAANLETSPRLQRVKAVLNDGQWHGTREIVLAADVCAVNTIMDELRAKPNELAIATRCVGRGRYEYKLLPMGQLELAI